MREVIPSRMWLGNMGDLLRLAELERVGIRAIVHLALEEMLPQLSRETLVCHIPLVDGSNPKPLIAAAIDLVVSMIGGQIPTLVYCSAGMSRSPAVVAGALAVAQRRDPDEGLPEITSDQPHDVSPGLWHNVRSVVQNRVVS